MGFRFGAGAPAGDFSEGAEDSMRLDVYHQGEAFRNDTLDLYVQWKMFQAEQNQSGVA